MNELFLRLNFSTESCFCSSFSGSTFSGEVSSKPQQATRAATRLTRKELNLQILQRQARRRSAWIVHFNFHDCTWQTQPHEQQHPKRHEAHHVYHKKHLRQTASAVHHVLNQCAQKPLRLRRAPHSHAYWDRARDPKQKRENLSENKWKYPHLHPRIYT